MGLRDRVAGRDTDQDGAAAQVDLGRFRQMLLDEVDLDDLQGLSPTQRRARLERIVGGLISRGDGPVLSTAARVDLIGRVVDEALGLGVLEPLLADDTITEIMVNGPDQIFVERGGQLEQLPVSFADTAQLMHTIDRIVSRVNRRVDESSPMVDARLPSGERVNIVLPPLALAGPTITIRRFPRAFTMDELEAAGSIDPPLRRLFAQMVRTRCNIVVAGGTGTGKTTFLGALSGLIDGGERIVTIEDSAELQLQQPHVVRLESRPANVEGKGQITIRDLVRNALRMRPDRIIVGEVRGGETLDMLQAMNTGHEGSLTTVHANSSADAVLRLETLASMSAVAISFDALRDQINGAVEVIVHLRRHADGSRRVAEVAAVTSRRRQLFTLQPVARFAVDPRSEDAPHDGPVTGHFEHFELPPWLAERFRSAGLRPPRAFADARPAVAVPVEDLR